MSQAKMKTEPPNIAEVAARLERYSPDAFLFLRQGLDFTVQRTHSETAKAVRQIVEWLDEQGCDLDDLAEHVGAGTAPPKILDLVDRLGGVEAATGKLSLHVSGEQLCWGLRDLAVEKWGPLAPVVLRSWGVRSTLDFGRMVFALVEAGLLQKQEADRLSDFHDVYDFAAVFDKAFRLCIEPPGGGNKPVDD